MSESAKDQLYVERKLRQAVKAGKLFPYQNIGSEFMPPLYEGDLLYMPTTFPGVSPTKAREILQERLAANAERQAWLSVVEGELVVHGE